MADSSYSDRSYSDRNVSSYALNLLILGVAIILIIIAYQGIKRADSFVGRVPMVPIGSGYGPGNSPFVPGVYPTGQPMMYPRQYYPAKYPYYDDSMEQVGRPCDAQNGCGALGVCQKGVCTVKGQNDTVFDMKL